MLAAGCISWKDTIAFAYIPGWCALIPVLQLTMEVDKDAATAQLLNDSELQTALAEEHGAGNDLAYLSELTGNLVEELALDKRSVKQSVNIVGKRVIM